MALAKFAHKDSVTVTWRSFELDPKSPQQYPVSLEEMLSRKYNVSLQEAASMNARVSGLAQEIGLTYQLSKARPGNTFDAHRLLHFATSRQLGDKATERMMQAYFSESLAIGDRSALAKLATEFGIDESEARAILESDAYSSEVRADEALAAKYGISGVPFFVINEKVGISGAQPVETFAQALKQAAAS
jgi:predicted DsbA family dithiol-disulfide isomerase